MVPLSGNFAHDSISIPLGRNLGKDADGDCWHALTASDGTGLLKHLYHPVARGEYSNNPPVQLAAGSATSTMPLSVEPDVQGEHRHSLPQ